MRLARAAAILALFAAYFLHVFRLPHDTIATTALGDWVDPYFINFLLEHWHHSVWDLRDPSSPPMYFPVRGTLGYSHGLILYAPFYLAVRPFLDPFQAYNATLFLVVLCGSVCLYAILRRFMALRFAEALLLTVFFFSSRNVINGGTGVWSQRASVFLIPPILLLGIASVQLPERRLRLGLAGLSGLLLSLLFTQDFYTAQFGVLILTLVGAGALSIAWRPAAPHGPSSWWLIAAGVCLAWAIAIALHPIERTTLGPLRFSATDPTRPLLIAILASGWFFLWHVRRSDAIAKLWARERTLLLAVAGGGLVGSFLFLWIYSGAYREHSTFPEEHLMNSLRPFDPAAWGGPAAPYDTLRPFVLVFIVGLLAWLPSFQIDRRVRLLFAWFLLVSIIVLVIPLKFGDFSIWKSLFGRLPGFSVIRDPGRIIPLYELAVVALVALFISRHPSTSLRRKATTALVLILLVVEWNPEVFDFGRPRSLYAHWVEGPIDIDRSCKSFYIKGASQEYMSRSFHMWALYNVDAMFISLHRSIPTLNGYSAWSPAGWDLANPQEPGYTASVNQWITRHKLRDVCALDIEKRTMSPITRLD